MRADGRQEGDFRTVFWEKDRLRLIDQRRLPGRLVYISCADASSVREAINTLSVRGAPAIGIAAAFGLVLGMKDIETDDRAEFFDELGRVIEYLAGSRPTAVNLFWALEEMRKTALEAGDKPVGEIKKLLLPRALLICEQDRAVCRKLGLHGAKLLKPGDTVLTHCNAGGLATADYGTALGVVYAAREQGKEISVYADETRPLLQGARLTAWELRKRGVEATLICDSAAGWVMKQGRIDAVLVGADRIAANGDAANKVGSYSLAVLAKYHGIPFYVCAPSSTFDFSTRKGADIPIEERESYEITRFSGKPVAPRGTKVYSPAFDVIPAELISALVTEHGVLTPPLAGKIKLMEKKIGGR